MALPVEVSVSSVVQKGNSTIRGQTNRFATLRKTVPFLPNKKLICASNYGRDIISPTEVLRQESFKG